MPPSQLVQAVSNHLAIGYGVPDSFDNKPVPVPLQPSGLGDKEKVASQHFMYGVTDAATGKLSNHGPVACHSATVYWTMMAILAKKFGEEHLAPSYYDELPTNLTGLINQMLSPQTRLKQASWKTPLLAGTVFVFANDKGAPLHSCVLLDPITVGGYNQKDWFPNAMTHAYSAHRLQVSWLPGVDLVKRAVGGDTYQVHAVPESRALSVVEAELDKMGVLAKVAKTLV